MVQDFLNNNFDFILALNLFGLVFMIVLAIMVRMQATDANLASKSLNQTLYFIVTGGEAILLFLLVWIFVINLSEKDVFDARMKVSATTEWVREPLRIHYIVDHQLLAVNSDGSDRQMIFEAPSEIKEYHFSPDGKHLLVATPNELFLLNRKNGDAERIDAVAATETKTETSDGKEKPMEIRGSLGKIRWSPKSDHFSYRISRWSSYASQDTWYIYGLKNKKKESIKNPVLRIGDLIWDEKGGNLYYPWFATKDLKASKTRYEIKVYQVPLATLKPQMVLKMAWMKPSLPDSILAANGVKLFRPSTPLSFHVIKTKYFSWTSPRGSRLGIDREDHLFYVHNRWWRRRLYKIPHVPFSGSLEERPGQQGGPLAIQDPRWFPSGKYVILDHYFFGVLILEPQSGRIGILVNDKGHTFGWYKKP